MLISNDAIDCFKSDKEKAQQLLVELLGLYAHTEMTMKDRTAYIVFLINVFQSIWNEVVQPVVVRLVSLPLWTNLIDTQRARIFESHPKLAKTWAAIQKLHDSTITAAGGDPEKLNHAGSAMDVDEEAESSAKKGKRGTKAKNSAATKAKSTSAGQKSEENEVSKICVAGSFVSIAFERHFLVYLINDFFTHLNGITADNVAQVDEQTAKYLERFLELQIDLLNQLPTRRFYRTLFESLHFVVLARASVFHESPRGKLFKQLLAILHFYERFEIDDFTGEALTDAQMSSKHYSDVQRAQATAFKHFQPELKRFSLTNVAAVDSRAALEKWFATLSDEALRNLCERLMIVWPAENPNAENLDRDRLMDVIVAHLERRQSQIDAINAKSLYPDEKLLWDTNAVPQSTYTGDAPLALPKLNLQFLTFHDHLLRNFTLFRLESAYEIREDLEDSIKRLQPRVSAVGQTIMKGWARMALPISHGIEIKHVAKKVIGEAYPEKVIAEIKYHLPQRGDTIRGEWDALKQHDIIFVVAIKAKIPADAPHKPSKASKKGSSSDASDSKTSESFPEEYGIISVRGAEVLEIQDETGRTISDVDIDVAPKADKSRARSGGVGRTLKVLLDPAQYHHDLLAKETAPTASILTAAEMAPSETPAMYKTFNVLIRRSTKENNFKAILETIRQLMNTKFVVPKWLTDVFLGYGDPTASTNIEAAKTIDYVDTFLSVDHARQSFPNKQVEILGADEPSEASNTKKAAKKSASSKSKKRGTASMEVDDSGGHENVESNGSTSGVARDLFKASFDGDKVVVEVYQKQEHSPYPASVVKRNPIHFTPTQIGAISSAMNKGLTLVIGPPGTGKTDVAVQIVSNWYHNFAHERTLLVTHSNSALNQIFEKIMVLDVDERHLLRLGHGGGMLETDKDFSKPGRVNFMLQKRIDLLARVERLATSLNLPTDVAYSVETAKNFFTITVKARWEKFLHQMAQDIDKGGQENASVSSRFPFTSFFADLPQPLFKPSDNLDDHVVYANLLWDDIKALFDELEECRPLEVLRSSYDRGNYLLTKQAKIVAMTCTHAALKRGDLVKLGFKFDNILMEEAGQILEIETFIPMMLQEQALDSEPRLKRVVLIGDHNQLPPVVKNMAFQRFSHLDQSLFTRFVRLGVPTITLDAQGRARPSIAALYAWRYSGLENLSHVASLPEFTLANPGFAYDYQLIDVPDYQGMGEMEPNPHFIQNLGEAEYVVATYMYMRMLGYPREKISIITSYNGQKHLIRDVIKQRCAWDSRFGTPHKITTVDRFQGQQNDYILLSLVRTRTVGHLRDVRRLVVAMSRARLGLYVFGRRDLFKDCYELTPTFSKLLQRPTTLQLVKGETYTSIERKVDDHKTGQPEAFEVADVIHMGQIVLPSYQAAGSSSSDANAAATATDSTNDDGDNASESSDDVAAYEDPDLQDGGDNGAENTSSENAMDTTQ